MDQKIVDKYLAGQCSDKELTQLLNWFQTREGQAYLIEHLYRDWCLLTVTEDLIHDKNIASEKIFNRIQQSKQS